jgi:hypothetical protein
MPVSPEFERALLLLDIDSQQREAIVIAARFAELLDLSLVGLFAFDEALRQLAGYPSTRELVSAGGTWRPMDIDRLAHEHTLIAEAANRMFNAVTRTVGVPATFEIVTGQPIHAVVSMSRALDVLVVPEPARASASATHAFSLLLDAAMRSPASVLLVPRAVKWRAGPIVAVAGSPNDPSIQIASAIAAAAHEKLVTVDASDKAPFQLASSFANGNECLIVIGREHIAGAYEVGREIAEQRRVPVLILEPMRRAAT